jgi:hypothetical protein
MRTFLRSISLVATIVGAVLVGVGGAVMHGQSGHALAAKSDRLTSVGSVDAHYLTVQRQCCRSRP